MLSRLFLVLLLTQAALALPPKPKYPYPLSLKLIDFSDWVSKECHYKKGFLTSTSNGFRWSDGTRARFWGVNIANRNLWIERSEIDAVVDQLAASGVNLVRFEALDSKGALLEIPGQAGTRALNSARLDTLHYWISKLHQKGMYYYLDLIDFREFQAQDGVEQAAALPRAARPYAVFDPKLIELQKEYAGQLLTTVNPYTKLSPVQDPALVLLEICNESGFFLYPKQTDNLIEPYRSRFQKVWNQWLRERYPQRSQLAEAWGTALGAGENPEQDSVRLPQVQKPDQPARQRDGVEFFYQVERAYFATMRDHLRGLGLKIPLTAVMSSDVAAELAAVAAELDFVSENHYADHPSFGGAEWQGKYFYNNKNSLRDDSRFAFAPFTAQLRWESKPVVIREWASCWPNQYRASSIPEAAAYARLQDFDGMLLFGYKTGSVRDRLVEFGFQVDPTVWDLFALGAVLFLRGDVATPSQIALLEYPDQALFSGLAGDSDLVRLGLSLRLASSRLAGKAPTGDLTVFPVGPTALKANDWLKQLPVEGGGKALDDSGRYRSLSHQVIRDSGRGLLTIQTPRTLCLAGEFSRNPMNIASPSLMTEGELSAPPPRTPCSLRLLTQQPIGALMCQSLDGKDLVKSQRWVLKMVSVAENTGQKLLPTEGASPGAFVMDQPGTAPVLTRGSLKSSATVVTLWSGEEVKVDQINGTWELLVDGARLEFWSDVPGSRAHFQGQDLAVQPPSPHPFLAPTVVSSAPAATPSPVAKPETKLPFAPTFP